MRLVLTDFVFDLSLMNLNHLWYVSIVFNIFRLNSDMLKQCLMNLDSPNFLLICMGDIFVLNVVSSFTQNAVEFEGCFSWNVNPSCQRKACFNSNQSPMATNQQSRVQRPESSTLRRDVPPPDVCAW
jgi:hypothetical protein